MTTDLGSDPTLVSTSAVLNLQRQGLIGSLRHTQISHVHGVVTKSVYILSVVSSSLNLTYFQCRLISGPVETKGDSDGAVLRVYEV